MADCTVLEDIRRLLSGTSPLANSAEVEEALSNSRSKMYAKGEDIKECNVQILHNASTPVLIEAALQRENGSWLTSTGALSVSSGAKTGRSPKDKRLVDEPNSEANVWWGPVNIKMDLNSFMINRERAIDYLNTRDRVYVIDGYAGWDPTYRIGVRVMCCRACTYAGLTALLPNGLGCKAPKLLACLPAGYLLLIYSVCDPHVDRPCSLHEEHARRA